jgi:hypothetical protein
MIIGSDGDPLLFLSSVVKDESRPIGQRVHCAGIMLPFVYPKLSYLVQQGVGDGGVVKLTFNFNRNLAGSPEAIEPLAEGGDRELTMEEVLDLVGEPSPAVDIQAPPPTPDRKLRSIDLGELGLIEPAEAPA